VEDVVWLPDAARPVALVVVTVAYRGDGPPAAPDIFALLVGAVDQAGDAAVAPLVSSPWPALAEVSADRQALVALLAPLAHGAPVAGERGGALAYADASAAARRILAAADAPAMTPLGAEQSNTSVRIGTSHVFKLFRRLQEGDHPEIEIGRFLGRAGFASAPALEGSLTYVRPDGGACALGALETWLDNAGDGWRYVVGRLAADAGATGLTSDVFGLGATTAAFHATMAGAGDDGAFAPAPITGDDLGRWRRDLETQASRTLGRLAQRIDAWDPSSPDRVVAAAILDSRHGVAAAAARLTLQDARGCLAIRIHGDFHLGQTLKTPGGFAIIDFEGEPAKPLDERRQKHCALKDVAGMLRSFEYAAAVAAREAPAAPEAVPALRTAYLDGYLARARKDGARFLPSAPAVIEAWTAFFELEKVLYEVEYELDHRPDWVWVPLRGLAVRLQAAAGRWPREGS
jgi:maltose alpha-D-glucosyltransferase/alpha-amylase